MRTDSIFYQIFQTSPNIFFELIGKPSPRASTYSFSSQEVKQSRFQIDGILVPPIYATELPIYFVEVQGYRDTERVLYPSFFAEIFLYLSDYRPANDWCGVLIFTERRFDPGLPLHYQDFANSDRLQRVYLDELSQEVTDSFIGLAVIQLIGVKQNVALEKARQLIERANREVREARTQRVIIELIETIVIYKFPKLTRQEIESMLGLNELKQTKVYQEALEEGRAEGREQGELEAKLGLVAKLLNRGLSIEEVAELLNLEVEQVRQVATQ